MPHNYPQGVDSLPSRPWDGNEIVGIVRGDRAEEIDALKVEVPVHIKRIMDDVSRRIGL